MNEVNITYEDSLQTLMNEKDNSNPSFNQNIALNRLALERIQEKNRGYTDSLETKNEYRT